MRQEDRLGRILERLAADGSVGVAQLAAELGVSTASVRRDLQFLEEQRLLSRTHGGAVANSTVYELPLRYRSGRHGGEKRRIAAEAAVRVDESVTTLGLTGGTTTTELARQVADRRGLTIVTNALNIASELAVRPELRLIVTGGVARSESYELVGQFAEATLEGINLDLAVVGVDGITARGGLTTYQDIEAHTNNVMIQRAGPRDRRRRRVQSRPSGAGTDLRGVGRRRAHHRRLGPSRRARAAARGRHHRHDRLTRRDPPASHQRPTGRRPPSGRRRRRRLLAVSPTGRARFRSSP